MENLEKTTISERGPEIHNLPFEKIQYKEGVVLYIFDHVAVAVDTTGKNYKDLPEILFATFDNKSELNLEALNQPDIRRDGVDMEGISQCIGEVAKDAGVSEFWFYPNGKDKPEDENKREQARLRLFKRHVDVTPAPGGFGYVMKIPSQK